MLHDEHCGFVEFIERKNLDIARIAPEQLERTQLDLALLRVVTFKRPFATNNKKCLWVCSFLTDLPTFTVI